MYRVLIITRETFTLLRRDRIFIPVILAGFFLIFLTAIISEFTIEELAKVFFDIGLTMFNLTGSLVAILWGTKIIADAKNDGAIDSQLATPISRSEWLVGKFLGMAFALALIGLVLAAFLIGLMYYRQYAALSLPLVQVLACFVLGWIVLAAVSIFFTTFATQTVAMFSSICLFLLGLIVQPVSLILTEETQAVSRSIVDVMLVIWNLQYFNITDILTTPGGKFFVLARILYGITLIIGVLSLGSIIFRNRDVSG